MTSQSTFDERLVSIGTHSLFLHSGGPANRQRHTPAVIIEAGLGGGISEWVAVQQIVAQFASVYSYDRGGYGRSERSPNAPTAENRVRELRALLTAADIRPPWLLVGHSYGGWLVMEFLRVFGAQDVAGMVLVDCPKVPTEFPQGWDALMDGSDYHTIVGLEANRCVSDAEWTQLRRDNHANEGMEQEEARYMDECRSLVDTHMERHPCLLGDRPLSVIFTNEGIDFEKIYDYGVERGNATDRVRKEMRELLDGWEEINLDGQTQHLNLSSRARMAKAEGIARTHNLQYVKPEVVTAEIRWVMDQIIDENKKL